MEQLVKKESQKRLSAKMREARIQRQIQVRQQAMAWTEATRKKFEEAKEKGIKFLSDRVTQEVTSAAIENIQMLTKQNDLAMAEIGMAHRAAAGMQQIEKVKSLKRLKNQEVAKNRGAAAMAKHFRIKESESAANIALQKRKEEVRKAEDAKSRELISRMPLVPANSNTDTRSEISHPSNYRPSLAKSLRTSSSASTTGPSGKLSKARASQSHQPVRKPSKSKVMVTVPMKSSSLEAQIKNQPVKKEGGFLQMARIKTTSTIDPIQENHSTQNPHSTQKKTLAGRHLREKYVKIINPPQPVGENEASRSTSYTRFFDASLPRGEAQFIAPQGLAVKEVARNSPDAWEKGKSIHVKSQAEEEGKARREEEMIRKAEERGRLAIKRAILENNLKEVRTELLRQVEDQDLDIGELAKKSQVAYLGLEDNVTHSLRPPSIPPSHSAQSDDEFSVVRTDEEFEFSQSPPQLNSGKSGSKSSSNSTPVFVTLKVKKPEQSSPNVSDSANSTKLTSTHYYNLPEGPFTPTPDGKLKPKRERNTKGSNDSSGSDGGDLRKRALSQYLKKVLKQEVSNIEKLQISSSSSSVVQVDPDMLSRSSIAMDDDSSDHSLQNNSSHSHSNSNGSGTGSGSSRNNSSSRSSDNYINVSYKNPKPNPKPQPVGENEASRSTSYTRFFDASLPRGEAQFIAPQGLAVKEVERNSPDAWEKGKSIHVKSQAEEKARREEEMIRKAGERGRLARKRAVLENNLKEVRTEPLRQVKDQDLDIGELAKKSQVAYLGLEDNVTHSLRPPSIPPNHSAQSDDEFSVVGTDEEFEFSQSPPQLNSSKAGSKSSSTTSTLALVTLKVKKPEQSSSIVSDSANSTKSTSTDYYNLPEGPFTSTPDGKLKPKRERKSKGFNDSSGSDGGDLRKRALSQYLKKVLKQEVSYIEKLQISSSSSSVVQVDPDMLSRSSMAMDDDSSLQNNSSHSHCNSNGSGTGSGSSRSNSSSRSSDNCINVSYKNPKAMPLVSEESEFDSGSTVAETSIVAGLCGRDRIADRNCMNMSSRERGNSNGSSGGESSGPDRETKRVELLEDVTPVKLYESTLQHSTSNIMRNETEQLSAIFENLIGKWAQIKIDPPPHL